MVKPGEEEASAGRGDGDEPGWEHTGGMNQEAPTGRFRRPAKRVFWVPMKGRL